MNTLRVFGKRTTWLSAGKFVQRKINNVACGRTKNDLIPFIRFYTLISGDRSDNLFMNLLSGFNAILPIWLNDDRIGKEVAIEVPPKSFTNGRIDVP